MSSYYESSELLKKEDDGDDDIFQVAPKFLPYVDPAIYKGYESKDNETPIFSTRKMMLRIPSKYTGDLRHMTVCKNWLVCILATPKETMLFRFFLHQAIPPGEIPLDKYLAGYKIARIFLDPSGHHTLVALVPTSQGLSADFLYIHDNGPKVRRIEKFKDHELTAVAFNPFMGTESTTGAILLGTSKGLIFETELSYDADKPAYKKQNYDLGLGRNKYPITGLELLKVPNTHRYIVIATTADCIYTFQEVLKPEDRSLQGIFAPYVNGSQVPGAEERRTDLLYSVLRLYAPPNDKFPKLWGWLCGAGIRVGEISPNASSAEGILQGDDLISLDFEQSKHLSYEERMQNVPKSFVLTDYHILLLYSDHITGICLLNQKVVYEEYFQGAIGKLLNIVRDHFSGTIYVYSEKGLYNLKITDEERDIWRLYLEKGSYDMAEFYAAENVEHLNEVLEKKAEVAYDAGNYELAATIYADTCRAFQEIALKFMELEDKRPIIKFMKRRLLQLQHEDDADSVLLLVVWLTDLYLTQINHPGRSAQERAKWQAEFDEFMKDEQVIRCAQEHRQEMREIIDNHNDAHNMSQFAIANEDYEEVVKQQIIANKYSEALKTLTQQRNLDLYYKYCPFLMEHVPQETVDVLISQGRKLHVKDLIPTLIVLESAQHIEEAIRYLEFVIYKLDEVSEIVHNYLIQLYALHKPEKMMGYLEHEGRDQSGIHYNATWALSWCKDEDIKEACVFLYSLLGMWIDAVDLALTFDEQLAKETASKPPQEEIQRELWFKIACKIVNDTNDIKKTLQVLEECHPLLHIEYVLPFFQDFDTLDDFKEPIIKALKEYNQQMSELQHDFAEGDKQVEQVQQELDLDLPKRSIRIEANDLCSICESVLMIRPFFIFLCGHKFHYDCMEKQVLPLLSAEQKQKLSDLRQQYESIATTVGEETTYNDRRRRERIKKDMDEILASECALCGLMIEAVDQPFVEDWQQGNDDWD